MRANDLLQPGGIVSPVVIEYSPCNYYIMKYQMTYKHCKEIYFQTDSMLTYIRKYNSLNSTFKKYLTFNPIIQTT